ncbi:uncharacterized protein [Petaurus breviceps papuanus]|uniref:uncharacterized protein isoform X3 n=1 Tax=Petaurus breviceps papuanus TaxID=3040969 RepID=UPI0036DA5FA0
MRLSLCVSEKASLPFSPDTLFHGLGGDGEESSGRTSTSVAEDDDEEGDENEKLGGLFRVKESKRKAGSLDCSKFPVESPQDWDLEEKSSVVSLKICILGLYTRENLPSQRKRRWYAFTAFQM